MPQTIALHTIELLSAMHDGLVTTRALREAGVHRRTIAQWVQQGLLTRVRAGAYASTVVWRGLWPEQRHRLLVRATMAAATREYTVSHMSAAAMHGFGTVGEWPEAVHVSDATATGGASAGLLAVHRGAPEPKTQLIGGVRVTSLLRTLADVAVSEPPVRSIPVLDAGLRRARAGAGQLARRDGVQWRSAEMQRRQDTAEGRIREQLFAELDQLDPRRGRARAEFALAFANGRADSVGESLCRVRFSELGFELPELQVVFRGVDGSEADVDFWWLGVRKIGEFDGKHKYMRGAILANGQDPGEVVFEEKRREDALRRQADSVTRWLWAQALDPLVFLRFSREQGVPMARRMPRARPFRG